MPVHACTDVTGFGLLGHLLEMLKGSGNAARLQMNQIPILPDVWELISAGIIPGGTKDNRDYTQSYVKYDSRIGLNKQYLLNDAQTSGGLLIAVEKGWGVKLMNQLKKAGIENSKPIGTIESESEKLIIVN
jgi:selenide,water dikinase